MNERLSLWSGMSLLAILLTGTAAAQTPTKTEPQAIRDDTTMRPAAKTCRASQLIGRKVENAQGEKLGKIEDIVLDESDGSIAYAVLSFGGFLGMGDKLFAIPFTSLEHKMDKDADDDAPLVLNVDKEVLKKAPGFDKDHWPNTADRTWGAEIHQYYNQRPYWEGREGNVGKSGPGNYGQAGHEGIGDARGTGMAGDKIDVSRAQSYEGTITRIVRDDPAGDVVVKLKTADNRELSVCVAPQSFLTTQKLDLSENDRVKVRAVVSEKLGSDHVVATEITKGDKVVTLRHGDGAPAWTKTGGR